MSRGIGDLPFTRLYSALAAEQAEIISAMEALLARITRPPGTFPVLTQEQVDEAYRWADKTMSGLFTRPAHLVAEPWHGTAGGYRNHDCRCTRCTEAQRVALAEWRAGQRQSS